MKSQLPKELRGKYVTRAAFAKMQAEKQQLEKDIKLMVMGGAEGGVIWNKWRKHFKFWSDISQALREKAEKELPMLRAKLDKNPKAFK